MKIVAILLACFVAAQASSYPGWGQNTWGGYKSNDYCAYPTDKDYCLNVPFERCWCTAEYYSEILKQFPKKSGDSCDEEFKTNEEIDTFVDKIRDQLKDERKKIKEEMESGREAFEDQVDHIHETFKDNYKCGLLRYLKEDSDDFKKQLDNYKDQLKNLKELALGRYDAKVDENKEKIKQFHEKLLLEFKNCLTTRKCRVDSYILKVDGKAKTIKEEYKTCLKEHNTKRKNWVIKIFKKIYKNEIKKNDEFNKAMEKYQDKLDADKDELEKKFNKKVDDAVTKMKNAYRCNYICYFNTGCYGFDRNCYSKSCPSLPTPPKYDYKLVTVCLFDPKWKGCKTPKKTKKDDEKEEPEEFDEEPHNKCIDKKAEEYTDKLDKKVEEWKKEVEDWKKDAKETLEDRVSTMKPKSYCGKEPTEDEIKKYRDGLKDQIKSWCDSKEASLKCQYKAIETQYKCQITTWQTKAKSTVLKIKQEFTCCKNNKKTKTKDYTCVLDKKIAEQKRQLKAKLDKMYTEHKCLFNSFFKCSFGKEPVDEIAALKKEYLECAKEKYNKVLEDFDSFWEEEKKTLTDIYKCEMKCKSEVRLVGMRTDFKWNFCAPSTCEFKFYC